MPPVKSQGSSVRLMPAKDEGGNRRKDARAVRQATFQHHGKPRREQFGMIARDRHDAALADIEGDGGDMRGGIILPLAVERRNRVELVGGEQIVERHHAVRQIAAEAAHVANGKYFRRHAQRELAMIEAADMAAGDQRLGADARERRNRVGAPPQQRQRRSDHSRAQHAEHGQDILDDIRQLDADNGVGRQAHARAAGRRSR